MNCAIIIPARFSSTRFPGKPLVHIDGKPMIQHTYERSTQVQEADIVVVATDDHRIKKCVEDFGGIAVMTSPHCKSGTDRVAEAARDINAHIIVNIQGDEPLVCPKSVSKAINTLTQEKNCMICTLKYPITSTEAFNSPDIVKVVTDKNGYALYFSRLPIPYIRNHKTTIPHIYYKHIGVYVMQQDFLFTFTKLSPSPLEELEGLEQLRILENGYKICVVDSERDSIGVDTPQDIGKIHDALSQNMA